MYNSPTKQILMLGSVPMSLNELQLAPAILASVVRKRGHDFKFIDINLRLYQMCDRDKRRYGILTEVVQDVKSFGFEDLVIQTWYDSILNDVRNHDVIVINVFSVLSQAVALRLCQLIHELDQTIPVLMGGIGSHKRLLGGINKYNSDWAHNTFDHLQNDIFGQVLLDNGLIAAWQKTVGTDVLESRLPQNITKASLPNLDFSVYDIPSYEWKAEQTSIPMLGSHGCVRQCSFCDVIKHFPTYSFIEADQLTKDIVSACDNTKIYKIQFMDSLVNGSMKNFLSLLSNLANSRQQGWLPKNFSWSGTYICRPKSKQLDKIHEMLGPSGVDNLIIGVETGSDRVRFEMEKKFSNADLLYEMEAFSRYRVKASALFFPSWPTETEKDFHDTLGLFNNLAKFAQTGTLDSISLGTTGFALIDGTPIDKNKHKIKLEQGPAPWLWHCGSNPGLTFWETVRRRLLMAEWAEMVGIRLDEETQFRRYLAFNLQHSRSAILEYSGPLSMMIDINSYLPKTLEHTLKMQVVNSGDKPVRVSIRADTDCHRQTCPPGISTLQVILRRQYNQNQQFLIDFEFSSDHESCWAQWNSGDYYDTKGLYLDNIWLDNRDITHWGWHQLIESSWYTVPEIPSDYYQHRNLRCITKGMRLTISVPAYRSLHSHLARLINPEIFKERAIVDEKISNCLNELVA